jgi:death-on-curing protein
MEVRFLSLARVLRIHRTSIDAYGGEATVRDMGLLESAVAQPRAGFGGQYLHEDLSAMAAAYAFHIAGNHPFVDGNKRTAALAAYVFLALNEVTFRAPEKEYEEAILAVARGEMSKAQLTDFFRRHVSD